MKKIISFLLALSVFGSIASASLAGVDRIYSGEYSDYNINTPPKYVFEIEGKEFILLDDSDGFFIMTKDVYGRRAFDPNGTQKFDMEDTNNIAYWLNNEFLEKGNGTTELKLPENIIKYVDYEHIWETEAGFASGNCPTGYSTKAGIALLSQAEWRKYYQRFGCVDDIPIEGWWLRTPRAVNGGANLVLASITTQSQRGQTFGKEANNSASYYVRPVFYLTDDFFKNVKLDIDNAGEEILAAMARHFQADDLKNIYTEREIRNIGIDVPYSISIPEVGENTEKNFLNGDYESKLVDESTNEVIMVSDKEQYLYTAFPKNPKHNYELELAFSCSEMPEKSVTLTQYSVLADGTVLNEKDLLITGGNKDKRNYAINVTDVSPETDFVIFVINIANGNKGVFKLSNMKLKKIMVQAEITNEWAPVYHLNSNDNYKVNIETNASAPQTFVTSYSLEYRGRDYIDSSSEIKLNAKKEKETFNVSMKNMRYGSAMLNIEVKLNGVFLTSFSQEVVIMDEYNWEEFNEIPRHGMNIGPGILDTEKTGDEFLAMMQRAGFNETRTGPTWARVERGSKGNYTYTISDTIMGLQYNRGMNGILGLSFSNPLYVSNEKIGPTTPEEVEGFVNYALKMLERYPQVKKIEIWNEPNNVGFWAPDGNVYAYANLVKAVATAVRQYRPDVTIYAGAIDISKRGPEWTRQMFDLGIWDYIDGFSTHPYYHTEVNDVRFLPGVKKYTDIIEENGGWKTIDLTEIGWTTYGKYELEPTMAEEYVKIMAHGDYLDMHCDIFNFADTNEAFGLLNVDYSAKPTYAAVTNYNIRLADATFLTKLNLSDECHTFLYKKDGKPIILSWCNTGGETTITLPDSNLKTYDMYGNIVAEGNVIPQNSEPYYIYGLDTSYFATGMCDRIIEDYDVFVEKYSDVLTTEFKNIVSELRGKASLLANMNESEIKDFINLHYKNGIELMKLCGDDRFEAYYTNMYQKYHNIGLEIADYLMTINNTQETDGVERLQQIINEYEKQKNDIADEKSFAREILRHAKRYSNYIEKALENSNIERNNIAGWNIIVNKLCDWYEYIITAEEYVNTGVYFNLCPPQIDYHEGDEVSAVATIYNKTSSDKVGVVEVIDSTGNTVLSIPDVTVAKNGKTSVDLKYFTDITDGAEKDWNKLKFISEDYTYTLDVALNVTTRADISMEHSEVPLEQLSNVSFKVKNTTSKPYSGTLKVTPPEGWRLSENAKNFDLEANGETIVNFVVISKEQTAFNFYDFKVEAVDNDGKTLKKSNLLLDFSVIVKEDNPIDSSEFTGDISNWSNAYPTYLNPPNNVDSMDGWKASDYAARVFTKWDEEYFYLLVDVYDSYHNQQNSINQIYAGDSIQIAIDAGNTKSTVYDSDDYEYGFAMDNFGKMLAYAWQVPEESESGEKPSDWVKILRNDVNKNTRYFVKIPKDGVNPMELKEGNVIGFNLLLNDANLLGNRDNTVEITFGINSAKNPSYYRNWKMVTSDKNTAQWDKIAKIFNVDFEADEMAQAPFDDISGHWAETNILNAYNFGLANGMGNDKFMPNSELTVAEALQFVKKAYNLPDAEYQGEFSDVKSGDWFAAAVASVNAAGMLPETLISGTELNPNKIITREAFAAIITANEEEFTGELPYNDKEQISEWAKNAALIVYNKGYMIGDDKGDFNPQKALTRAEAVTVILKIAAN